MGTVIDLTGQRFGRLTVIERAESKITPNGSRKAMWKCRCDCGNIVTVKGASLKTGNTKSCGCLNLEKISERSLADLTGQKFGRLTVLERSENSKTGKAKWLCKCDCGNEVSVMSTSLISGRTKSCGCFHRETSAKNNYRHGLRNKRLYGVWQGMIARCYNKNNSVYENYGGRGISVCKEWRNDFQSFYDWSMANGYDENAERGKYTLDRINTRGNYEPDNCRWITIAKQQLNKRTNVLIEFCGKKQTLKEWSDELGISYATLHHRLFRENWGVEKAFTTPVNKQK